MIKILTVQPSCVKRLGFSYHNSAIIFQAFSHSVSRCKLVRISRSACLNRRAEIVIELSWSPPAAPVGRTSVEVEMVVRV